VRVLIDGQDYSAQTRLVGNQVLLTPGSPLAPGQHQVLIEAVNLLGLTERANWAFFVAGAPTQVVPRNPSAYTPFPGTNVEGTRPILSAEFPENLSTARMTLDNQEVGPVQLMGNRASWQTQTDMLLGQHIASIDATGVSGQPYRGQWQFTVKAAPTPLPPPPPPPGGLPTNPTNVLTNLNPPPSAVLRMARPWISADFPQPVNNARMLVDGIDVTAQTQKSGTRISWTPNYDLQAGQHTVLVDGVGGAGQVVAGSWTFTLEGLAPGPTPTPTPTQLVPLRVQTPQPNQVVGRSLEVRGQGPRGAVLRIAVRDLSTRRSTTFETTVNRGGNFNARVDLGWVRSRATCELTLTATDRNTSQQLGSPVVFNVRRQ